MVTLCRIDRLPSEILRLILREATSIEDGFSYPIEVDEREQEIGIASKIALAMESKRAISLVSKRFHALGDEFLLEVLHIGQQKQIRPLLAVLGQQRENGVTRGWWSRHLIVNFRQYDIDWGHGKASLWGLIPACPRLEDLRCFLYHTTPPGESTLHRRTLELYRIPVALPQTIATTLGRSLRYLHFGDHMEISLELAISLVSHLKKLEVCLFDRLVTPNPDLNDEGPRWPSWTRYIEDEYPIEEEAARKDKAAAELSQRLTTGQLQAVTLPSLQIFKANTFFADVGDWQVPNLREVIVGFDCDCTDEASLAILRRALVPHATHISRITLLEGGGGGCLWDFLDMLPGLQQMRFPFQTVDFIEVLARPHSNLTSFVIILETVDRESLPAALLNIQENIRDGLLPSLKTIDLEGSKEVGRGTVMEMQGAFARFGVSLTVTFV
ncbi:hypothetical protein CALCODRAFT_500275 [Calocera cornea HHB12733]|uniref:F-box domain-containing protein n=1 Tax=Calocera cornea HHB12733 TaxID=1353952 RepID=A0A165E5J7_9BASI|nr:hypothetical protein CALCODRAFT_500275 [Calocera cornea HHB12733]